MPRQFGPIQGAGTAIIEREAGAQILPSEFGTTVYVGRTEKGDVGELIDCPKRKQFLRKCGSFLDGSELPDNAFDFYGLSEGAGRLFVIRVTDGNEIQSNDWVLSRHNGTGEYVNRATRAEQKNSILRVKAKNGGRWGGAKRILSFDFTVGADITETTIDTGQAMLEDEFVGATLQLLGVTTRTYTVISNDTAGVLTVRSDATMASDLASESPANGSAVLYLDTETRQFNGIGVAAGDAKALSVRWKDGEESQTSLFGMDILVDGERVRSYNNLSLDPSNKWYIDNVVNNDPDNDFVEIEIVWAGSFDTDNRPAGWWGNYQNFSAATMTAEVAHVRSVTTVGATDPGFVNDFVYPDKVVRQRITLTFADATTFSVATDADYGAQHTALPDGTVGTPYATTLAGDNKGNLDFLPTFTVKNGVDAWATGDTVVIDVDPFPVDLASGEGLLSGKVLLNGDNPNSERANIVSNTVNTITFANTPATPPTAAGDLLVGQNFVSSAAITFPTTGGNIDLIADLVGSATLAYGAEADIATLVSTLNTAADGAGLPNTLFKAGSAADTLEIDLVAYAAATSSTGEDQFFELITAPAELNLTAGLESAAAGDSFRVEAAKELRDGYDGVAPTDSDYIAKFDTSSSLINRLRGRNVGLTKIGTPGVTATLVQQAGLNYAAFRNYQYRIEVPSNITEETSVIDYINNTIGRSDYGKVNWPSYGNVVNKTGNGLVLQSLTGAIHGREAREARIYRGFHKAAAGESVTIPNLVSLPTGEKVFNEEILNPQGINVIKKKKGVFVLWGDRTIYSSPEWKFAHAREYISHISNVLIENFDFIIFALNDETTRDDLIPVFQQFFLPEWQKRAIVGDKPGDAARLKIDSENNTELTTAAGDLLAEVELDVVDVVERFTIGISKAGVTASAS